MMIVYFAGDVVKGKKEVKNVRIVDIDVAKVANKPSHFDFGRIYFRLVVILYNLSTLIGKSLCRYIIQIFYKRLLCNYKPLCI